jgi:hypothetical protein
MYKMTGKPRNFHLVPFLVKLAKHRRKNFKMVDNRTCGPSAENVGAERDLLPREQDLERELLPREQDLEWDLLPREKLRP